MTSIVRIGGLSVLSSHIGYHQIVGTALTAQILKFHHPDQIVMYLWFGLFLQLKLDIPKRTENTSDIY